jgi:hypothetical protein
MLGGAGFLIDFEKIKINVSILPVGFALKIDRIYRPVTLLP